MNRIAAIYNIGRSSCLRQSHRLDFSGKVILVTGASSGIGAATAIQFSKEGAHIALVDRNGTKLNNVAQECTKNGADTLIIKADVTNDVEVKTIIDKTIDTFGKLDVLINNAGILREGSLMQGNMTQAYDVIMKVNVRAVIQITTLAVPHLIKSKGNIINVSSVGGLKFTGGPLSPYCISKAALNHFTKCAALELAQSGVRVNSVNPGPVRTDLLGNSITPDSDAVWESYRECTTLKRFAEPEEVADMMLFLASEKAKSITGAIMVINE